MREDEEPPTQELVVNLTVHWKKLSASAPAQEHLARRLSFALGRFSDRVRGIRAVISDQNGVRGGVDKACRLQARTKLGLVQVVEVDSDVYAAMDLASERLRRTLARLFDRQPFQNNGDWRAEGLFRRRHGLRSSRFDLGTLP